jgi:magnesium-transporting ATPase (P-type)
MSQLDLSDKALYDMIGNGVVVEKAPQMEMMEMEDTPVQRVQPVQRIQEPVEETKPKTFKIERSLKTFVIFILVIALVAAFIYFTIYRLGWGVKECMNKNYHDCAALLTPEMAPLAATGLLAFL